MIENLLKDCKKRLIETNFNIENVYFLFTDLEETYSLSETKKIAKIIKEEKYLIFKISRII